MGSEIVPLMNIEKIALLFAFRCRSSSKASEWFPKLSLADEMCFRFNNCKNDFLFRDTMLKLIGASNLEYKNLTAKVKNAA